MSFFAAFSASIETAFAEFLRSEMLAESWTGNWVISSAVREHGYRLVSENVIWRILVAHSHLDRCCQPQTKVDGNAHKSSALDTLWHKPWGDYRT
jgi:hypothetical protein